MENKPNRIRLTVKEASEVSRRPMSTFYTWLNRGAINCSRAGGVITISAGDVARITLEGSPRRKDSARAEKVTQ
jgi:hypothetical protein